MTAVNLNNVMMNGVLRKKITDQGEYESMGGIESFLIEVEGDVVLFHGTYFEGIGQTVVYIVVYMHCI